MGSLTIIFILELVTGFVAFFFVDKVKGIKLFIPTFASPQPAASLFLIISPSR